MGQVNWILFLQIIILAIILAATIDVVVSDLIETHQKAKRDL